ncbi:MAG: hypothetical protein A2Y64_06195 [Candidatus Coatesbacteria bacterium RBG_13_66_14]|uniref:Uncharacterized protein n=1 Tax=Candidatus Coatesbacteria bacterium RBG_13_66_14 TaxID=1817816 RepID=A0A1F5EX94_9BACT|nr:MAG: hypothetical protein A2Y64_06195 [Candidatus Coatesbacteria bacterium RBG_13_66_14]
MGAGTAKALIGLGTVEELRGNVEEGLDTLRRALAEEADPKPGIALTSASFSIFCGSNRYS